MSALLEESNKRMSLLRAVRAAFAAARMEDDLEEIRDGLGESLGEMIATLYAQQLVINPALPAYRPAYVDTLILFSDQAHQKMDVSAEVFRRWNLTPPDNALLISQTLELGNIYLLHAMVSRTDIVTYWERTIMNYQRLSDQLNVMSSAPGTNREYEVAALKMEIVGVINNIEEALVWWRDRDARIRPPNDKELETAKHLGKLVETATRNTTSASLKISLIAAALGLANKILQKN